MLLSDKGVGVSALSEKRTWTPTKFLTSSHVHRMTIISTGQLEIKMTFYFLENKKIFWIYSKESAFTHECIGQLNIIMQKCLAERASHRTNLMRYPKPDLNTCIQGLNHVVTFKEEIGKV